MIKVLLPGIVLLVAQPSVAQTPAKTQARDQIWAMEQAIYDGRARGDMAPYFDNAAPDFAAWPPGLKAPRSSDERGIRARTLKPNSEAITLSFVAFSINGDAAVIYYRTHRTRMPDGSAADERFEVTHSWVRLAGRWRLMGGMARAATTPE